MRSDPSLIAARRRRAALPVALASLVGLVVVSGTRVPATLAGSSQPPLTVVLPPQAAQQVAPAPPPPAPAAPPVEEPAEPAVEAPPAEPPVTAATPAAADQTAPETDAEKTPPPARDGDPEPASPIEHVFLIALGAADLNALAADATAAPYLAGTLVASGTLLSGYRTVAHGGLADRIAAISGQGPTPQTRPDCTPGDGGRDPADALADDESCVYGAGTEHIGDQLQALKRTWKAYVEPAAEAPAGSEVGSGPVAPAPTACDAGAGTTRRNPFLWFRGTLESADCDERNVPLTRLRQDLRDAATTPAFAWIASEAQQGSADADRFLERIVPQIQDSPAFADGGLIAIVGDRPPASPEAPAPPADAAGAGVPVGALLISPRTPSGRVDATPADAFTLLRTLQEIYDLRPLGRAGDGVEPLPEELFAVTPARHRVRA